MKSLATLLAAFILAGVCSGEGMLVSVKIERSGVLGPLYSGGPVDGRRAWLAAVEVRNSYLEDIEVGYMSGSWDQMFRVSPDHVFAILGWEYRGNGPSRHRLAPGASMTFRLPVVAKRAADFGSTDSETLRVGFIWQRLKDRDAPDFYPNPFIPMDSILWSQEVALPRDGGDEIPVQGTVEKAAQPGATDNSGDAQ